MDKRITILLIATVVLVTVVGFLYLRGNEEDDQLNITSEDQLELSVTDNLGQQSSLIERAVETDTLKINNCSPNPEVLRTEKGATITVVNEGDSETSIAIDRRTHTIPASGSLEIIADSSQGQGIFPYTCDSSEEFAGYILLEQK